MRPQLPELRASISRLWADRRRRDAVLLAAISLLGTLQMRTTVESSWVWLEVMLILGSASLVAAGVLRQCMLALLLLTPPGVAAISRVAAAQAAVEMTMLTGLGVAALAIALAASTRRMQAMSIVGSGFLALFTTVVSDDRRTVAIALCWITLCVWHLVTNHWERLELCGAAQIRRSRAVRPLTLAVALLIATVGGMLSYGRFADPRRLTRGFMPTSDGSQWSDPSAKKGVGTGDIAVAGKHRAESFGPVDSDWLLESNESTLFDMFSESLGPPKKTKLHELRQGLASKNTIESHSRSSRSDRGAGSFTLQREAPQPRHGELEDRRVNAVIQWAGPAGIRLAMHRYQIFDGHQWRTGPSQPPRRLPEKRQADGMWFGHPDIFHRVGSGEQHQTHTLKVLGLDSPRIPTPGLTAAVHIKDVNRNDFFGIHEDGSWWMPGRERIPPLTVIHLCQLRLGEDDLIANLRTSADASAGEPPLSPELDRQLDDYLEQWTRGITDPYQRLRGCLAGLRRDFTFDRQAAAAGDQPLRAFLTRRRGGDHHFATVAALLARKIGLESRLVTGFYVPPRFVDLATGTTNVRSEDVHVWAEVALRDGRWFEIEPTPGYRPPDYQPSLWLRAQRFAAAYWPMLILGVAGLAVLLLTRLVWMEWLLAACWHATAPLATRRRLKIAFWVIETRARLVGRPRAPGEPQRDWLLSLPPAGEASGETVRRFCDLADRLVFGTRGAAGAVEPAVLDQVVPLFRIKALKTSRGENSTA
jgi:hypothetical protein